MDTQTQYAPGNAPRSKASIWTGRFLSGFAIAFLLFDVSLKLMRHPMAIEGTIGLGYPAKAVFLTGALLSICLVVYVIPRTAILGAVLLTGYLGGAVATHVRVENPLFTHVLFPIYVAVFLWVGLGLRDPRVRTLLAPAH